MERNEKTESRQCKSSRRQVVLARNGKRQLAMDREWQEWERGKSRRQGGGEGRPIQQAFNDN